MNTGFRSEDENHFEKTFIIDAPTSRVWEALTVPELMNRWMMPDLELEISTSWQAGSPFLIRGEMNGKKFENKGTVLQFEPDRRLQYSHLSSISQLPDRPESYSIFTFRLTPSKNQTILEFTASNFPNESIYKHLAFYWNVTLEVLKKMVEEPAT